MKKGERLNLTSSDSTEYLTVIEDFTKSEVVLKVLSLKANDTEPPVKASLFQALAKGDKMDTIIQKAVELGVYEIYPVMSERCIVHADEKRAEKKLERWNRISAEAAKQCGRGIIPTVHPIIDFDAALPLMKKSDISFICYETSEDNNPKALFRNNSFSSVAFFIGPEGGISPLEIEAAHKMEIPDITLGKLILRTETAATAVLSMLLYETRF
jgi:16S rRNA (uracil1498-N3)-methyltransferase